MLLLRLSIDDSEHLCLVRVFVIAQAGAALLLHLGFFVALALGLARFDAVQVDVLNVRRILDVFLLVGGGSFFRVLILCKLLLLPVDREDGRS